MTARPGAAFGHGGNTVPDTAPPAALPAARARWRAAEDQLYPSLISDPGSYQRAITAVQTVVAELRHRATSAADLAAIEAAPEALLASACPAGVVVPADLLVAAACGMRDREIAAADGRTRRSVVIDAARAAGAAWAVLDGPPATELTEGRSVTLHLASGDLVEATVDPWSGRDPYSVQVVPAAGAGTAAEFADRDAWHAELTRVRAAIEARGSVRDGSEPS